MASKGPVGQKSDARQQMDEPTVQLNQNIANNPPQPTIILKEDDKMPLFLIKLWNIVEDPNYYDVIRWDESGYSFHILDPYSFCRNVLPQYFKHNNLNSLIRQLNMYGFRKMTPIERTSLARAESDQDHLEFSHPCFVRDHPELLTQIKRKTPHNKKEEIVPQNKDLSGILDEIRTIRNRQSGMEERMNELVNENVTLWQQMDAMRATHVKQQQIVNKLVQFLVTLVQPKRLGKRHLLAIDEASSPKQKRSNQNEPSTALQTIHNHNVNDILDNLIREISARRDCTPFSLGSTGSSSGPIISDVTDELDHLTTNNRMSADFLNPNDQNMNFTTNGQTAQPTFYTDPMQPPVHNIAQPPQQVGTAPMQSMLVQDPHLSVLNNLEEPFVLSPNAEGLPFTPGDFADYLSGVDQGIDNCRDLIGDHWNAFDFDTLMDGTGESPEDQSRQHLTLEQTHPVYNYSPTMTGQGSNRSSPGTRPSPQQAQVSQMPKVSTVQSAQVPLSQSVPMMQQSRVNPNLSTNFQPIQPIRRRR